MNRLRRLVGTVAHYIRLAAITAYVMARPNSIDQPNVGIPLPREEYADA